MAKATDLIKAHYDHYFYSVWDEVLFGTGPGDEDMVSMTEEETEDDEDYGKGDDYDATA